MSGLVAKLNLGGSQQDLNEYMIDSLSHEFPLQGDRQAFELKYDILDIVIRIKSFSNECKSLHAFPCSST